MYVGMYVCMCMYMYMYMYMYIYIYYICTSYKYRKPKKDGKAESLKKSSDQLLFYLFEGFLY